MAEAPPPARVAAVVVVWKALGSTMQAIESLLKSSVRPDPLICIAQELGEPDLKLLATMVPGDDLIVLQENVGFATAANLGISRAADLGCEWVFLANNDATFQVACIARCLKEANSYARVAAVSPAISYADRPDRLWFAGAAQSHLLGVVWHHGHFASATRPPSSGTSDYIPSCSALLSIEAWAEVGPMRDDYFMYFEDVDWGDRARVSGWQLRYLGEVLASHEMGGSSDHAGSRYMSANTAYYLARNPLRFAIESPTLGLRVSRIFGTGIVWTLYNLSRIRPSDWPTSGRALIEGLLDGWRGRMGRRDPGASWVTPWIHAAERERALMSTSESVDLTGLRVCIVYDCLFPWTAGGAERWYRRLAEYLPTLNANVRYVTTLQWSPANAPNIAGVEVVVVAPAMELYEADGTRRVGPPLRFGLGVFVWFVRHRHEVDVVHVANFPFFSLIAARLALVGSGAEIYVDWHEVWPRRFWDAYAGRGFGALGFLVQELCVRLTQHAFVFWSHNKERLRDHGFKGDITTLAGLLPQIPVPTASLTTTGQTPTVLFVGRLIQDKGVRLLPEMLRLVLRFQPNLRLIVVGTGPEEALLRAAFSEFGIADQVDFRGTVPDGELERLRSAACCSIVASTREGYGISAVESLAVGTPIVVVSNPENLAVHHVVEGVNGCLVEPSPAGLADGVRFVIEAGEELRRSTRKWFLEQAPSMTIDSSIREVASLYATRAT